ncbi:alginate lyase family protein [Halomontanus rarus]|uniref:alginate lyase family protein n=1 Tax=Halomontanus rarus TaxID=3034020 RepID=UPI0023E777E5|nr:alginate lyase family protein [Halovivax sp. TS33]
MQAQQLAGVAERKVRHAVIPRLPIDFDQRYEEQIPDTLVVTPQPIAQNSSLLRESLSDSERERYRDLVHEASKGKLTLLNRSIYFGDEIDWEHEKLDEYPLLWRLKLQSFEFLEWAVLGFEDPTEIEDIHLQFQKWLLSWTADNPIGDSKYLRRSWIPHSVSLRILNWSRYASWCEQADLPVDNRLYGQIYKNALFLENHVEFEIGGNHLIENAIALVMAGMLFEDHDTGWAETGLEVLEHASETQFLADGGHFERSPMYHLMVLRRYATAYNLLSDSDYSTVSLKTTVKRALGFLEEISMPANEIPLLNDSVHGEQIDASSCITYSDSCGLSSEEVSLDVPLGSGYRKLRGDDSTLLIDVGDVGPAHLPAHSHNDQLSVLLWISGIPVLTDTGVYDYAPTPRRQYSRSVSAHNTAQYADTEPIPVGGSYLMGKRAVTDVHEQTAERIRGQCSQQSIVGPNYEHHRKVSVSESEWTISDRVASDASGKFTVRYHFAPSIEIEKPTGKKGAYTVTSQNCELATIQIVGDTTVERSEKPYFERYGQEEIRSVITATSSVHTEIETHISVTTAQSQNHTGTVRSSDI